MNIKVGNTLVPGPKEKMKFYWIINPDLISYCENNLLFFIC